MQTTLLIVLGVFLALLLYREYWTRRALPRMQTAAFDGELFKVNSTYIARRPARNGCTRSIVCFPGFLEDMRYFLALYADTDSELILVNNANYHCAFDTLRAQRLDWPHNPFAIGSIEHDGFWLGQVLRELVGGDEVVLHGHSRGGAVVLECGRQFPELVAGGARSVTAILEAPVLPQAKTVGRGSDPLPFHLICFFMPVVLGLSRKSGAQKLPRQPMMQPLNDLKREVCGAIYTNPCDYRTSVANVRSIRQWQAASGYELYRNFDRLTVVVGERDDVLDNASMLASAEKGRELNPGVDILRTENTNHFPALEQPHYLHRLAGV